MDKTRACASLGRAPEDDDKYWDNMTYTVALQRCSVSYCGGCGGQDSNKLREMVHPLGMFSHLEYLTRCGRGASEEAITLQSRIEAGCTKYAVSSNDELVGLIHRRRKEIRGRALEVWKAKL